MCLSVCKTTLGMFAVNLSMAESTIYASQIFFFSFSRYIVGSVTCDVCLLAVSRAWCEPKYPLVAFSPKTALATHSRPR
jgi:hypothetical protein